jgi:hypothetical protein
LNEPDHDVIQVGGAVPTTHLGLTSLIMARPPGGRPGPASPERGRRARRRTVSDAGSRTPVPPPSGGPWHRPNRTQAQTHCQAGRRRTVTVSKWPGYPMIMPRARVGPAPVLTRSLGPSAPGRSDSRDCESPGRAAGDSESTELGESESVELRVQASPAS